MQFMLPVFDTIANTVLKHCLSTDIPHRILLNKEIFLVLKKREINKM